MHLFYLFFTYPFILFHLFAFLCTPRKLRWNWIEGIFLGGWFFRHIFVDLWIQEWFERNFSSWPTTLQWLPQNSPLTPPNRNLRNKITCKKFAIPWRVNFMEKSKLREPSTKKYNFVLHFDVFLPFLNWMI